MPGPAAPEERMYSSTPDALLSGRRHKPRTDYTGARRREYSAPSIQNFAQFSSTTWPRTVADLGFPRGGCANPKGGANLLSPNFSRKLHENEEIWLRGAARVPGTPPPPLDRPLLENSIAINKPHLIEVRDPQQTLMHFETVKQSFIWWLKVKHYNFELINFIAKNVLISFRNFFETHGK